MSRISAKGILREFDKHTQLFSEDMFPMLDNGYAYPIDVRLSAFADDRDWCLIIEQLGYSPRGIEHGGVANVLYCYGSCVTWGSGRLVDEAFLNPTDDGPEGPTFDGELVRPEARTMRVRDQAIPLPMDPKEYEQAGVELSEPPDVRVEEMLRVVAPRCRELLLATEAELRRAMTREIPLLLRLDEWLHPNIAAGEKPSESESFVAIADVIERRDPHCYNVQTPPNTHWSNWPDGGQL